jgi:hypothetical protein
MSALDRRLHVYRDDLADRRLRARVDAQSFVDGVAAQCVVAVAGLHKEPDERAMQLTQVLQGETLLVFERKDGWAWVQLDADQYVGYVRVAALSDHVIATTHRISP